MRASLLKTELDAIKRINEQYELIRLLPQPDTEAGTQEQLLVLQEKLVKTEQQLEESKKIQFELQEKTLKTYEELESIKTQNTRLNS